MMTDEQEAEGPRINLYLGWGETFTEASIITPNEQEEGEPSDYRAFTFVPTQERREIGDAGGLAAEDRMSPGVRIVFRDDAALERHIEILQFLLSHRLTGGK